MKLRKLFALLMALVMVFALAACGSSTTTEDPGADAGNDVGGEEAGEEAGGDEDEYKVFAYGTDANSTTFDTASDLQTNSGNFLVHAVGESLWTVDDDGNVTLKLAESYNYTDEALTITLKDGVQFSNGNTMDGNDVIATIRHNASSDRTASMYAAMNLDNATADGLTVTIPMNSYDAAVIDILGNAGSMIQDDEVITDDFDYSWLIGTGPYMLKGDGTSDTSGWEESVSYTLVRNPYYWGEAPYYDELDVYFYSEESTRYADFQAGKLDAVYLTEATYVNNLGSGAVAGATLVQKAETAVYGFEMAATTDTNEAMIDINVRKAFAHALDIESMVDSLGEGIYQIASSYVGEGCWAYLDTGVYDYDPDAAAAYLAEAGYSVDNPLTIHVYAESTAWHSALFEAAQSYCAAIGIDLDLSGLADFATILPVLLSGDQDMTMGTGSSGSGNDPANLLQQFGPLSDNALIRMVDEDQVAMWNQAVASKDIEERTELYHELIQAMYDNYMFVPVYVGTKNFGVLDVHSSFEAAIDNSNQVDPTLLTD